MFWERIVCTIGGTNSRLIHRIAQQILPTYFEAKWFDKSVSLEKVVNERKALSEMYKLIACTSNLLILNCSHNLSFREKVKYYLKYLYRKYKW